MTRPLVVTLSVTFVAWALAALLSQGISDSVTQSSAVWLATGVTFGALLVAGSKKWPAIIAGAGLATVLIGLLSEQPLLPSLAFGINEALSAALGAWLAKTLRAPTASGPVDPVKAYAALLLGALLTSAFGATVAIGIWSITLPQAVLAIEWRVWLCTTFVGILLVTPLIISFADFRPKRSGGMPMARFATGAVAYLLFFVVAALIFSNDVSDRFGASLGPTLTYLPLPFMVVTAMLWKDKGGSMATLIGALTLIIWTNAGGGPFAEIEAFRGEAVLEVQGYVAAMALLVGVVTALGALGEQALAQAQAWRTRYRQVLESTRTVVANFDAHTGLAQWGDGASELLGTDTTALPGISQLLDHAEAGEQAALRADWQQLVQGQRAHALWKTTLYWSNGHAARVGMRLSAVRGGDGQIEQVAALLEVEA